MSTQSRADEMNTNHRKEPDMALLDLQGMAPENRGGGHGGGGQGSSLSLALCDSTASITLCL
jgi:hypothetical protein